MNAQKNASQNRPVVGHYVCSIVSREGNAAGVAKYMGDFVDFSLSFGRKIVAGKTAPEFTDEGVDIPEKEGESIVAFVAERYSRDGYLATTWGLYREYKAALEEIKKRDEQLVNTPKPAPATPPIPMVVIPKVVSSAPEPEIAPIVHLATDEAFVEETKVSHRGKKHHKKGKRFRERNEDDDRATG